jgi:hypothetical protein
VPSFWTPHAGGLATNITGSIACRNRRVSDAYRACTLYFGPGTPARPCSYSASWLPCNGPPLKREVTPTLVAARLTAATSVQVSCIISRNFCPAQLNSTIEDPISLAPAIIQSITSLNFPIPQSSKSFFSLNHVTKEVSPHRH